MGCTAISSAMSSTDTLLQRPATRSSVAVATLRKRYGYSSSVMLRTRYAMSNTEIASAILRSHQFETRSAVLT
eukprot:145922-Rhodomonas_salina.2